MTTLAGQPGDVAGAVDGTGAAARFSPEMQYIVMDSRGDMFVTDTADYIVDSDNHTIRTMRCP